MAEPPEVQLVKEEGPNAPANNGSVARSDADVVVLGASSPTRPRKRDASAVDVLVMEEYGTSSVATTKDSRAESNNASVVDLTRCAHVERTAEEERLAQLERENRELKRKREQIPEHWREMEEGENLQLIDLPLPSGTGATKFNETHGIEIDYAMLNGSGQVDMPREELVASLLETSDPDQAQHFRSLSNLSRQAGRQPASATANRADQAQEEGRKRRKQRLCEIEAEEAERVISLFEQGGLLRNSVLKVQRVQNRRLWRKYLERRQEVVEACNSKRRSMRPAVHRPKREQKCHCTEDAVCANEYLLFHGANMQALDGIVKNGFETRIANLGGALGAGSYFARDSRYSSSYTSLPPRADPAATGPARNGKGPAKGGLQALQVLHAPSCRAAAMLLCRVSLGKPASGAPSQRIAPDGHASAADPTSSIFCVYDNFQAFPEYVVFFDPSNVAGDPAGSPQKIRLPQQLESLTSASKGKAKHQRGKKSRGKK